MKRDLSLFVILSIIVLASLIMGLTASPAMSQSAGTNNITIPSGVFSHKSLDAKINVLPSFSFNVSHATKTLPIVVRNPADKNMDVYVAIYRHQQWDVLDKLGTIGPGAVKTFNYTVEFTYSGKTEEIDRFGIVGKIDDQYLGTAFDIIENWVRYEESLKSTLSVFGGISAAILVAILLIIFAGVISVALRQKYKGQEGEYTLWTLFFPITRMRPWAERIADVIINPFFWLFELGCGAVLVAIILLFALSNIRPDIGILVFLVGGVAALFMPLIFLVIGWLADYYEREPFRFIAGMFMWGVMATLFAFFINTTFSLVLGLFLSAGVAEILIAVLLAPVVEETAKGVGLLLVSGHHEFNGVFDGILYGFAIGMGFAAIENWLYFASNAGPVAVGGLGEWTFNILYRSFLCSLAHGCFTAATGGMIGFFKSKRHTVGFALAGFVFGLPIAIFLHGTFNFTAVLDSIMQTAFGVPVPIFDPILTIVVTAIYICLGIYLQLKIKDRLEKPAQ